MKTKILLPKLIKLAAGSIDHVATGTEALLFREAKGVKQFELAERMAISAAMVSRLESGERAWTPKCHKLYKTATKALATEKAEKFAKMAN